MDQGLFPGQPDDGYCQRHTGQQVQALGNHADQGGHHTGHRLSEGMIQHDELVAEQGHADGDQGKADDFDQSVHGFHHAGLCCAAVCLGLHGQTGGIAVRAHVVHTGAAFARDDKTAGQQLVANVFGDGIRLAGDERLVHRYLSGKNGTIGGDLVARAQFRDILAHHFMDRNGTDAAVTNHFHLALGHQVEFLQRGSGLQLLHDTDDGVGGGNDQKRRILELIDNDQQHRQDHEDHIKEGQCILTDDAADALGVGLNTLVGITVGGQISRLLGGQSLLRIRVNSFDHPFFNRRFSRFFLFLWNQALFFLLDFLLRSLIRLWLELCLLHRRPSSPFPFSFLLYSIPQFFPKVKPQSLNVVLRIPSFLH